MAEGETCVDTIGLDDVIASREFDLATVCGGPVNLHSPKKVSGHFTDFLYKTAFLKSKFKDDPVRVQKRTVSHFKGLE